MDLDGVRNRLAGVVSVPVTPFDVSDTVDEAALTVILERMATAGIEAFTANGNTGEYYAMSAAETRATLERTVEVLGSGALVIAGVGGSVPHAVEAARHAREVGAQAVMVHQPVHPYIASQGWVAYHRAIANAVPDLAVVVYIRDSAVTGRALAQLGAEAPNVICVKYAVADAVAFGAVAGAAGRERFVWLAGLAESAAPPMWAMGASGFTSGLANVAPELALQLLGRLRAGDQPSALAHWDQIAPFEQLRAGPDNVSVVKEALAVLGLCGRAVRPPSHELSSQRRAKVASIVRGWGLSA